MDAQTLAIAIGYTNKQVEEAKKEGFKVQVEQDRSILDRQGKEKVFYFLPKSTVKSSDGYDEFVYANNKWEQVGVTDVDLSTYGATLSLEDGILSLLNSSGTILSQVLIDRTDLSEGTVTLNSSSLVYDGTIKIPTVTSVVLNGVTLVANEDYKIISTGATNAGSYILQVKGKNTYKGTIDVPWSITKAEPTISGDESITIKTLNTEVEKTYTTNSDGTISFSIENPAYASVTTLGEKATITSIAEGNTNLIISLTEGLNYQSKTFSIPLTVLDSMCFGVMWNYGISSPILTRLTGENDPNNLVTHSPTIEPTACIGTTTGQSWFDDYMPWAGMVRKNYVNGEIVDFIDYNNGETYVYIPQFWSKIINDTEEKKMYIYISAVQDSRFTLHPGSGKYMSRYECNSSFLSAPGTKPRVGMNLNDFRTGITAIDNKHYQYDIHTYAALELLYIVEFAHLNTQSKIGAGITSGDAVLTIGETDILTYHTGRVDGTADDVSAVQYRWIENLWGNVWNWVDGILIQNRLVYICNDRANYASSITSDYKSTGLYTPTNSNWHKTDQDYNDCYLIPLTTGNSVSTYTCDYYYYGSGLRGLNVGGSYNRGFYAGLFSWFGYYAPGYADAFIGGRAVLVDNE